MSRLSGAILALCALACSGRPAPDTDAAPPPAAADPAVVADAGPAASTAPGVATETPTTDRATLDDGRLEVHDGRQLEELSGEALAGIVQLDLALAPADHLGFVDRVGADDACGDLMLADLADRLPKVWSLRVSGCATALHAGLGALASHVTHLELAHLELDRVLVGRLAQLDHLEVLVLTDVRTAAEVNLAPLAALPVHTLALQDPPRDGVLADVLATVGPRLRSVVLEGAGVGHETLLRLPNAAAVESLVVRETSIGNFSLNQVKPLTTLRELSLAGSAFNDASPLFLRTLPLRKFECACPNLGDTGLKNLRHVATLEELVLPESRASGAAVTHLARLARLRSLTLAVDTLDDAGLAALAELKGLRTLRVLAAQFTATSTAPLAALTSLESLELAVPQLDDVISDALPGLTALRHLDLSGTRVSDDGIAAIGSLRRLESLNLSGTRVTRRLTALQSLQRLTSLSLAGTDVVDGALTALPSLVALTDLDLRGTLVTAAGIAPLGALRSLRRLDVRGTVVREAPPGLGPAVQVVLAPQG